jgi:hydroxyacylglutathione hydrolase
MLLPGNVRVFIFATQKKNKNFSKRLSCMKIEQIYTGCLAQAAYYIESEGEVAIIDPLREVQPYLEKAKEDKATIKYIFETHFHADFVSGHLSLSKATGAPIVFGPNAETHFESLVAVDGQEFPLGNVILKVLHTPGHTLESTCYLLKDEHGKERALFSGDTLFLGDVGRPDLAQQTGGLSEKDLAGLLYESLRTKIMPLPDTLVIYPAHGAGSACGKNLSKKTTDTLGNQKKTNYALHTSMSQEEFIEEVTVGLTDPPAYFPMNVKMNKEGCDPMDSVLKRGIRALSAKDFKAVANAAEAIILDIRSQQDFGKGHIPGAVFVGLDGSFAPWVGALIADVQQPLLLVAPIGREQEAITRLSRVGFDITLGYLKGGFEAWKKAGKEVDKVTSIDATDFKTLLKNNRAPVFDVRSKGEFFSEHVLQANNSPLAALNQYLEDFPEKEIFYLYCAGGYRSMIAASFLKRRGVHNFMEVAGGMKAIKEAGVSLSNHQCPSKSSF